MMNKDAVVEATFFYILAAVIGILLVLAYLLFFSPYHIISYISSLISQSAGSILYSLKTL
ncbi:MAG: hypothetical protein RAK22_01150 [Nanoarchaeota archaeon]|nr:hypothetical protein [Nanoarchaeota archaeon]